MLEIKNLFVQYLDASKPSIADISLTVERGSRVAILGPSGCGKTTLLNVVAKLITTKEAKIKGEISWEKGLQQPNVNMVFQEATLLPWKNVRANVAFGLEVKDVEKAEVERKVQEVIEMVGLTGSEDKYPRQLSVGMKQRVNFARALVCNPDLLLLDEPFSALDITTKKSIQAEFLRVMKERGITSILVTHSIQEAVYMADKIVVLAGSPSCVKEVMGNEVLSKQANDEHAHYELYDGE